MHDQSAYGNNNIYGYQQYSENGIVIPQQAQYWNTNCVTEYPWNNTTTPIEFNMYGSARTVTNLNHSAYVSDSITLTNHHCMNNLLSGNSSTASKILVNPHFKKKNVHINPNFKKPDKTPKPMNIHINPSAPIALNKREVQKNIHLNLSTNIHPQPFDGYSGRGTSNIHVNPLILRNEFNNTKTGSKNIPSNPTKFNSSLDKQSEKPAIKTIKTEAVYKSKNKLIRVPVKTNEYGSPRKVRRNSVKSRFKLQRTVNIQKRRNSVLSKYKIVKSSSSGKQTSQDGAKLTVMKTASPKSRINLVQTRYKIIKSSSPRKLSSSIDTKQGVQGYSGGSTSMSRMNKYHIDNRSKTISKRTLEKRTRYVYVDKFFNITHLAKNMLIKQCLSSPKPGYVQINGILYKKSPNSMKKANLVKSSTHLVGDIPTNKSYCNKSLKQVRTTKLVKISPSKLRKSNVPCSMYRKFGKCSGKDNGKCIKIHNPKHVVLCTKFLQGACVNKKCLLSHEILPEKMPTCKYFLEGSCSRDDCQYLHVKTSPKADICLDFLQGFCKKATECDKRHQFLCPDYEKHGKCPRKRCSFPHGERVRKINNFRKSAKKCSAKPGVKIIVPKCIDESNGDCSKTVDEKCSSNRYYENPQLNPQDLMQSSPENVATNIKHGSDKSFRSRPKLGALPLYIPLMENKS